MKYLLFTVLLMFINNGHAAKLNMLLGSYHDPRGDYCETNPGIQYINDEGVGVMVYKNSNCDAGLTITQSYSFGYGFGANAGLAFGYEYIPILPFVSLNYQLGPGYIGILPGKLIGKSNIYFYGITLMKF